MAKIHTNKAKRIESATSSHSNGSTTDIDINVHTTVLGSNCLPVHAFEISIYVSGQDASAGSVEGPTISGAVAYSYLVSGKVYMLVYHQVINFTRRYNNLMCPMHSWKA